VTAPAPVFAAIEETLRVWIEAGGYPALALFVLVENLFPPIPSEVVLPLAGFYVNQGTLAFVPAMLFATAGSVGGALILYALGRYGGRPVILRYGRVLRVTEERLERAEGWFERYGTAVVLFGRMVPGARSVVSIPAGLAEMGLTRFVLLTAAGSAAWNALLIGAGALLGASWKAVSDIAGSASTVVLIVTGAAAVIATVVWLWRRRRARRREGEPEG
jgi:membrane protein DedA with SNARE-associated domain